ncbi:hypothetical protein GCM10010251_26260 [Streptomyces aurantiogriseus]|uniref:Uncharacterized protein n=1 Tax=Streptomyces aurantiogriseus TaxID=66870 RepID=A0A918C7M8_9ACTN|nr:hypothetical protein GCM10010251_26260 [Streptomyces aurantiogriseus]
MQGHEGRAEWSQINFLRLEPLQFRAVEPKEVLTDTRVPGDDVSCSWNLTASSGLPPRPRGKPGGTGGGKALADRRADVSSASRRADGGKFGTPQASCAVR